MAAHAIVALLRWMFGYSEQADRHAQQALELATQLQHPYSLAYATFHAGLLELWNERVERAEARAAEVLELATTHDYQVWKALGLVLQGVTAVRLGRHAEGLDLCELGIQQYENLRSPPIFWPLLLATRADAFQTADNPSMALELLDQAIALAGPENWVAASLLVQKGLLLTTLDDAEAAERALIEAFEVGGRVGTITFQLKAATALHRLGDSPPEGEAAERLRTTLESSPKASRARSSATRRQRWTRPRRGWGPADARAFGSARPARRADAAARSLFEWLTVDAAERQSARDRVAGAERG